MNTEERIESKARSINARCFVCDRTWGDHDYVTGRCPAVFTDLPKEKTTFPPSPRESAKRAQLIEDQRHMQGTSTPARTGHTVEQVKAFRTEMFNKSMALIDQKGADYNRDQQNSGDTLFNLQVCELLGIVPSAEEGILVRLSDKFMRLVSLTKPGREAAVKDESVLDTIKDIHNYIDYLALKWLRRRGL